MSCDGDLRSATIIGVAIRVDSVVSHLDDLFVFIFDEWNEEDDFQRRQR